MMLECNFSWPGIPLQCRTVFLPGRCNILMIWQVFLQVQQLFVACTTCGNWTLEFLLRPATFVLGFNFSRQARHLKKMFDVSCLNMYS